MLQKSVTAYLAVLAAALSVAGCDMGPREGLAGGQVLFSNNCAVCHGADGEGKPDIAAPPIASLEQFYVEAQLHKFRDGIRGAHFDDAEGLRMKPMSMTLRGDTEVEAVASYIASLRPAARGEGTVTGDAALGAELYQVCAACHGADGEGNEAVQSPSLTLTSDWYLLKQLEKFKSGVRGSNPKDSNGRIMQGQVKSLTDEQALNNVVAYINTLGR